MNDNNDDNADDSSRIDTTPADVLSLTDLLGNDVEEVIQTIINTAQPLFPTQNSLEPCTSTHCTPNKACPNTATLPTSDLNMPQHEQTPGPSQSQATEIGLREFFCNFLQSQAPTQSKTTNRKKRVASLGESLTEKQAITRLSYIYIYIYIASH